MISATPEVSVVMAVYNGGPALRQTLDSVLSQQDVGLEVIVVDDGSTDETAAILDQYAQFDPRVRVFKRENAGLTRALVRGCGEARGQYIARQDAGDISLPGRLCKQRDLLRANPAAALMSCGTRFVGPGGEILYETINDPRTARERLLSVDIKKIRGPSHHGSVMFPRELYERVGGYRDAFYYAQDLDLWVRLAESGEFLVSSEILYQAEVTVDAISSAHREMQVRSAEAILEAARLRRAGSDEEPALVKARAIQPEAESHRRRRAGARARACYFIGMCLLERDRQGARGYFRQAVREDPLHFKSMLRLLQTVRPR